MAIAEERRSIVFAILALITGPCPCKVMAKCGLIDGVALSFSWRMGQPQNVTAVALIIAVQNLAIVGLEQIIATVLVAWITELQCQKPNL